MTRQSVELEGQLSPFMRMCVGVSLVAFAITPLVYVVLRYA